MWHRTCRRAHTLRSLFDLWTADASAIGTTVLQIKEIPERPAEFDGALCLFDLAEGVGEPDIREKFQMFGGIVSYEAGAGKTPAVVRFSTHEAALAAKRAASTLTSLCGGIDTLYNECSYDGREDLADDNGRGWYRAAHDS